MLLGLAVIFPLGLIALTGGASASASPRTRMDGTGAVTCNLTGKITFKPALHSAGFPVNNERAVHGTFRLAGCTGGTPDPGPGHVSANLTASFTGGTNTCAGLYNEDAPVTFSVVWAGNALSPSATTITDSQVQVSSDVVLVAPHSGTGATTGSFADAVDTTLLVSISQTPSQITTACSSRRGLASLTVSPDGSLYES
jgi:hypothetical protein